MNQATKTQIENEAKELYPSTFEFNQVRQDRIFYKIERESYIAGATKYAEILEQEKATTEMLRKSLAHETTQRIFDNEKGEKLVEALEGILEYEHTPRFMINNIAKALAEYKTADK